MLWCNNLPIKQRRRLFFRLPFFCPDKRKVTIGFPLTLLGAGFFGYFFFVAGDKEKVTF